MLIYPRKAALDSTTSINNRTYAPPRKKKINTMQLKIFLLSSSNLSFPLAKTAKSLFSTYITKINPGGHSPQVFIRKPWGAECHLREKQSTCLSEMHCQKPFKKKNNQQTNTHTKHPPQKPKQNQQPRALQLFALPAAYGPALQVSLHSSS